MHTALFYITQNMHRTPIICSWSRPLVNKVCFIGKLSGSHGSCLLNLAEKYQACPFPIEDEKAGVSPLHGSLQTLLNQQLYKCVFSLCRKRPDNLWSIHILSSSLVSEERGLGHDVDIVIFKLHFASVNLYIYKKMLPLREDFANSLFLSLF